MIHLKIHITIVSSELYFHDAVYKDPALEEVIFINFISKSLATEVNHL